MTEVLERLWNGIALYSQEGAMKYPSYWSNALAGEVGEFANQIKKMDNPEKSHDQGLLEEEYADIFIYWVTIGKKLNWDWKYVVKIIDRKLFKLREEYLKEVMG